MDNNYLTAYLLLQSGKGKLGKPSEGSHEHLQPSWLLGSSLRAPMRPPTVLAVERSILRYHNPR